MEGVLAAETVRLHGLAVEPVSARWIARPLAPAGDKGVRATALFELEAVNSCSDSGENAERSECGRRESPNPPVHEAPEAKRGSGARL